MIREFVQGQKSRLSDFTSSDQITVGISLSGAQEQVFDISCFGLDEKDTLSDDRYLIFYNRKESPCGGLVSLGERAGDIEAFHIDFTRLPETIRKMVFTITLDGSGDISRISQGNIRLLDETGEIARFRFSGADLLGLRAIILGEIYWKSGGWRFNAVGQGFKGDLRTLLEHFGGMEASDDQPSSSVEPSPPIGQVEPTRPQRRKPAKDRHAIPANSVLPEVAPENNGPLVIQAIGIPDFDPNRFVVNAPLREETVKVFIDGQPLSKSRLMKTDVFGNGGSSPYFIRGGKIPHGTIMRIEFEVVKE
jgi:stress response protein SCP2